MEYFYWLRVKSSNHLHTGLNLGYLKGTKFCLASYTPFLIAWLREYCTFLDNYMVNLKSSPCPKYSQTVGGHRARLREKENLFCYGA